MKKSNSTLTFKRFAAIFLACICLIGCLSACGKGNDITINDHSIGSDRHDDDDDIGHNDIDDHDDRDDYDDHDDHNGDVDEHPGAGSGNGSLPGGASNALGELFGSGHNHDNDEASHASASPPRSYDDSLIEELYSLDGKYTDSVGNVYNYHFHVPQLASSGGDARELNAEISRDLGGIVSDERSTMESGNSMFCYSVTWESFWHGSVVNILVTMETDFGFTDYRVYGYDFASGEELDSEDIFELAGYSESQFLSLARAAVEAEFEEYGAFAKDSDPDFYQQQKDWTLSDRNINDDMMLYWDDNGDIILVADIASFAGADSYYHLVPLE